MYSPLEAAPLTLVDLQQPVNKNHPLNRGRVAWWLALPNRASGPTWYDLMGQSSLALTGMGSGSNGWRGPKRPGGFASVLADGSAGYLAGSSNLTGFGNGTASYTASCWLYLTSTNGTYTRLLANDQPGENAWYLGLAPSGGTATAYRVQGGAGDFITGTNVAAGSVTLLTTTYDGTTLRLYQNGVQTASAASSRSISISTATFQVFKPNGFAVYINGQIDDVGLWNRALTAAEVYYLYSVSQRGYDGMLNRIGVPFYATAAAPTGGKNFGSRWWRRGDF